MSASPDSLSQDGRSNATIAVMAKDVTGRPLGNVPFRLDMRVDGQVGDFGTLSTRTVTTGSDGRATVMYTAPSAPPVGSTIGNCNGNASGTAVPGHCVFIVATSVGSDYGTAGSNMVQIRLVPPGVIIPSSSTPAPSFVVVPAAPLANASVQFDASASCASQLDGVACPGTGRLVRYDWDFGDGSTASGVRATHAFTRQQSYAVTLTVVNDLGLAGSFTKYVDVGAGAAPAPAFTSSPTAPAPGTSVNFDATNSKPGAGHSIVRYVWNWGDGSAFADASAPAASHTYTAEGTYVVTLTVADETGQTASVTGQVKVTIPTP